MGLQTFEFDNKALDFKLTNQSGEFLFYKSSLDFLNPVTLATKGYNLKLVDNIIVKGNKTSNGFGETVWVNYQKVDTTSLEYFKCILSEVKGISNKMIENFFEEFKTKENFINALKDKKQKIKGIGLKKRDLIIKKLETAENENLTAELAVLINNYDWAAKISKKIDSMEELYYNPYQVLSKLRVGFKIIDSICREKLGVSLDNEERNKYLVEYKFNQFNRKNSNYIDKAEFIDYLMNDVESQYLHCSITDYIENNTELIISEGNRVYKKNIYLAEVEGAEALANFEKFSKLTKDFNFEKKIKSIETFEGFELAESQKNAISEILFNNNISALIGGAGTGKSTITKFIAKILEEQFGLLLLAPTGVAGVRMTECTEKRANTIHSFIYSVNNFIEAEDGDDYYIKMRFGVKSGKNCLIIDESSMVSQELLYNLLKATKELEESSSIKFEKIIFIGDEYQLPSVGSGQILKDIIESGKIKIVKLTETFRQSKESLIIKNAKKVRIQKPIDISRTSEFFVAELKESMIRKVFYRFNEKYTDLVSFYKNFQIASTTNKTKDYINKMFAKGKDFVEGDKIINLKNDSEKGIYNGDKGIVRFVNDKKKTIHIEFYDSGSYVEMKNTNELRKTLDYGYCCTVHKLQGSESKAMMIILEDSIVTDHRLLYTAITRAKENCIILSRSVTEINNICQKSNDYLRKTTFKEKIRKSYKHF